MLRSVPRGIWKFPLAQQFFCVHRRYLLLNGCFLNFWRSLRFTFRSLIFWNLDRARSSCLLIAPLTAAILRQLQLVLPLSVWDPVVFLGLLRPKISSDSSSISFLSPSFFSIRIGLKKESWVYYISYTKRNWPRLPTASTSSRSKMVQLDWSLV